MDPSLLLLPIVASAGALLAIIGVAGAAALWRRLARPTRPLTRPTRRAVARRVRTPPTTARSFAPGEENDVMGKQVQGQSGSDMVVEGIVKNVIDRLAAAGSRPPAEVAERARREAARALARHADAPVQAFVPVIAEREVTDRLLGRETPEPATDEPTP
jgi:HAMP domain-containing protein